MAEDETREQELPLEGVGARLRNARALAGLSRADIAARTKIAERHLQAIEEGRLADLASRTYAVGFSRTYARAVGLNEKEIADAVRAELDAGQTHWEPQLPTFEPGDPARVPPSRLAWLAALAAVLIAIALFFVWRSFYDPAISLPDLAEPQPEATATAQSTGSAPAGAAAAVPTGGAVVFTALEPDIWVKFYDAGGNQLFQKQMAQGESYTVPPEATGPMVWTARPDALAITVGGKPVPMLGDKPVKMKDVPVTASALLARPPAPPSTPAATTIATPVAAPAVR